MASDVATMRAVARELLTQRATIRRAQRAEDGWGHAARTASSTVHVPCAAGERAVAMVGELSVVFRSNASLVVPHDAPVDVGDDVLDVQTEDGSSLGVRGRIARITRTPVLLLLELGGA